MIVHRMKYKFSKNLEIFQTFGGFNKILRVLFFFISLFNFFRGHYLSERKF